MKEIIQNAWGWMGFIVKEIIEENEFGNVIFKTETGEYWRICPEEVYCKMIAPDIQAYRVAMYDNAFKEDWAMAKFVEMAKEKHGELLSGFKYCLKLPGVFGGEYNIENMGIVEYQTLIEFSGEMAKKIKDIPEDSESEK
jgi:hypothetical protein